MLRHVLTDHTNHGLRNFLRIHVLTIIVEHLALFVHEEEENGVIDVVIIISGHIIGDGEVDTILLRNVQEL